MHPHFLFFFCLSVLTLGVSPRCFSPLPSPLPPPSWTKQEEALAMYDGGGKVIVCDPTCNDGVSDPSHCDCEYWKRVVLVLVSLGVFK